MEMSRRSFALLLLLGVLLRLLLIATSIGTNDVVNWIAFAGLVDRAGIGPAYARIAELNHPPLALLLLLLLEKLRGVVGLEIGDLLRTLQVAFDLLAAGALLDIGRSLGWRSPHGPALFYFLSPVSIFVTGFHGNTDPSMVALLLGSLALLLRERPRPLLAGVLFAAAVGIKVVPLLLLPLVLLWRRDRLPFAAGFGIAAGAIFLPFVATGGTIVLQRIFGYNPQPGNYGLSYLLFALAEGSGNPALRDLLERLAAGWNAVARHAVTAAIGAYSVALALRRERDGLTLLAGCGTVLLIAMALSPGIGMQYFLWPIAFLPFAVSAADRWTLLGVFSVTQFTLYTIWSGGFPWWFADSTVRQPGINLVWLANLVWFTVIVVTVRAVVRTLRPTPS
ncbi:MAG TPA: glycosyltransferase 87 family protein [Thermoanaerobaculia bacterium]|nr:glycosyltransferase 87 family protein [Thermoanaerobaculia bacterium]